MMQFVGSFIKTNLKYYLIILATCIAIFLLAFLIRPHDCKPTYGPAPWYYNTDLALWASLADQPLGNLKGHVLANRPVFAYLGALFAYPVDLLLNGVTVSSPTRASGVVSQRISTIAGLLVANVFCLFLYHLTERLARNKRIALLAAVLWATSGYAFAWSYHPTNQMGGLVVIFGFPLFLLLLDKNSHSLSHYLFCLGLGVLLLMKAYDVLPFIYVIWGWMNGFPIRTLLIGFVLFFVPTFL
jgi:hypothetical protein